MNVAKWEFGKYIATALVAALVVIGAFVIVVGSRSGFAFSQNPEDWARFGEYAGGTLGATYALLAFVGVMLTIKDDRKKAARERELAESTVYFQQAESALRQAVDDFLGTADENGRPRNSRRHWLNFARGVLNAQQLAAKIAVPALQEVWRRTEHYWRERVYDVLDPLWESFPAKYYGYEKPEEKIKNFATSPKERQALSEASLVFVYRWIEWPENQPDSLDRKMKFTEEEIAKRETFGPRGLAKYIRILRAGPPPSNPNAS